MFDPFAGHDGSRSFWYPSDPAGNFSGYHDDLNCVVDDATREPEVCDDLRIRPGRGPAPASSIEPDDLTDLIAGGHS
ncbi:hypothetical protein OG216_22185 [Streptomycetaceae bacterium NBC_01309]